MDFEIANPNKFSRSKKFWKFYSNENVRKSVGWIFQHLRAFCELLLAWSFPPSEFKRKHDWIFSKNFTSTTLVSNITLYCIDDTTTDNLFVIFYFFQILTHHQRLKVHSHLKKTSWFLWNIWIGFLPFFEIKSWMGGDIVRANIAIYLFWQKKNKKMFLYHMSDLPVAVPLLFAALAGVDWLWLPHHHSLPPHQLVRPAPLEEAEADGEDDDDHLDR